MRDTDAQLMMEAYDDRAFLTELASLMEFNPGPDGAAALAAQELPMISQAIQSSPGVLQSAWPWLKEMFSMTPLGKAAAVAGDVTTKIGDNLEALEGSLESIAAIITTVPDIIITGGVVVAALMGVKFLLKYLEDKRAKEALDDKIRHANSVISSVDKMFDPDQELLPRDAIKV
tara:strand:+ start:148 stop:669 length:522 start_codon:yes stop_codon:yes gene_type:complete